MSDEQHFPPPPEQPAPIPATLLPPQPVTGYAQPYPPAPQPVTGYAQPVPNAPQPPKKKTGWIIAIVVIVVLLLCCCAVGAVGLIGIFSDDGTTTTTTEPEEEGPENLDAEEDARYAAWQRVLDAFEKHDFEFVEPDDRAKDKAAAFVEQMLPDFRIEELKVEHGEYNEEEGWHLWDMYFVRLAHTSDPDVQTAYSFWVHTAEGDARKSTRDGINVEEDEQVVQIGGTWVVYDTYADALLGGIADDSYVRLMKQAAEDFPGGMATQLVDEGNDLVTVHVETWDSFCWSTTYDRIEATYELDGDDWILRDYEAVLDEERPQDGASDA